MPCSKHGVVFRDHKHSISLSVFVHNYLSLIITLSRPKCRCLIPDVIWGTTFACKPRIYSTASAIVAFSSSNDWGSIKPWSLPSFESQTIQARRHTRSPHISPLWLRSRTRSLPPPAPQETHSRNIPDNRRKLLYFGWSLYTIRKCSQRAQHDLRKRQARSQDMAEQFDEIGDHIYKTWHSGGRELPIRVEDISDMEIHYAEACETYSQLHKRLKEVNKECEV